MNLPFLTISNTAFAQVVSWANAVEAAVRIIVPLILLYICVQRVLSRMLNFLLNSNGKVGKVPRHLALEISPEAPRMLEVDTELMTTSQATHSRADEALLDHY